MHVFPVENLIVSLVVLNNTFLNKTETNKFKTNEKLFLDIAESSENNEGAIGQTRETQGADIQIKMQTSTLCTNYHQTTSRRCRKSPTTCLTRIPTRSKCLSVKDVCPKCTPSHSIHGPDISGDFISNCKASTLRSVKSYPITLLEQAPEISKTKISDKNVFEQQTVQYSCPSMTCEGFRKSFTEVSQNKTSVNNYRKLFKNYNYKSPNTIPSTTSREVFSEYSEVFSGSKHSKVPNHTTSAYHIYSENAKWDSYVTESKMGRNVSNDLTNFTLVQEFIYIPKTNSTETSSYSKNSSFHRAFTDQRGHENEFHPGTIPHSVEHNIYNNENQDKKLKPIVIHVFKKANSFNDKIHQSHKTNPVKVSENEVPLLPIIRLPDVIREGNDNIGTVLNSIKRKLMDRDNNMIRGKRPKLNIERKDVPPLRIIYSKDLGNLRPMPARYIGNYNQLLQNINHFPFGVPQKYSQTDGYQQLYALRGGLRYPDILGLTRYGNISLRS